MSQEKEKRSTDTGHDDHHSDTAAPQVPSGDGEMTAEELKGVAGGRYEDRAYWTNVPY